MSSNLQTPPLPDFDPFEDGGEVPSPCVNVCRVNQHSGLCEGCFRTLDEIVHWSRSGEAAKRAVWVDILQRQSLAKQGAAS